MAFPVQRGTTATKTAAVGTATANVPAITGITDGDLEIGIAVTVPGATISIVTGSGWAAVTGSPIDVAGGEKLYVWWKIHDESGGSSAFSVASSSDHVCATRFAYQGGTFDAADPFEGEVTGTETTSDTSFSWAPGSSTTGPDRLVVCIASSGVDSNTAQVPVMANAALASLALIVNQNTANGTGGGYGATHGELATAGSFGTFSVTYNAASPKAYIAFAVKPVAGGTAHDPGDPGDSVTMSDSFSRATTTARAPADTASPSDAFARVATYARAVNDSVTPSDNVTPTEGGGSTPHTVNPSDSVTPTDSFSRARLAARTVPDSVTPSDNLTRTRTAARTVPDTLSLADAQTQALGIASPGTHFVTVTDSISAVKNPGATGHTRDVNDSVTPSDNLTRTRTAARTIPDTLSLSDNISPLEGGGTAHSRTPADTLSLADAQTRTRTSVRTPADSVTPADAFARTVTAARTVPDTVALTDALNRQIQKTLALVDSVTVTDSIVSGAVRPASLTVADILNQAGVTITTTNAGATVSASNASGAAVAVVDTTP